MNLQTAIERAQHEATLNNLVMAVVNAPIENADQAEPYGYCPMSAVDMLFRHRTEIVRTIKPKTIWNSDGTDGPCLICPPPVA
jgi:hypothetical protein